MAGGEDEFAGMDDTARAERCRLNAIEWTLQKMIADRAERERKEQEESGQRETTGDD